MGRGKSQSCNGGRGEGVGVGEAGATNLDVVVSADGGEAGWKSRLHRLLRP
jgi:hypothetical protein